MSAQRPGTFTYALFVMVLLTGFCLRLALLDAHGLEGDDGVTLNLLPLDTSTLIDGLRRQELDVHPPLYFVVLQGWVAVAGDSLTALRLLNILADVLTGALLLRLTGLASGRRAALMAGTLWICAPLILHTLYPIRMYPLLGLWVTAGSVCVVALVKDRRAPVAWQFTRMGLLGLCVLAALYTHIFGVLAAAGYALALLVAALRGGLRWRILLLSWGVIVLAGGLFAPFGVPMLERLLSGSALGAQASAMPANAWEIPSQMLLLMLTHRAISIPLAGTVLVALLFVLSLVVGRRAVRRGKQGLPTLLIVTWSLLGSAMLLAVVADIYRPRYVAPFVPLLLATISVGLCALRWRVVQAGLLLALLSVSATGVVDNLRPDAFDDWRSAAQFVTALGRPGDQIVIIPAWGAKAFRYHYTGDLPIAALLSGVTPDVDINTVLEEATAGKRRVWLLRYQTNVSDPQNRADAWFRDHAVTLTEVYPTAIQVKGYTFGAIVPTLPAFAQPLSAQFDAVMALRGADMPITQGTGRDWRLHPPSAWVTVTLYLEKLLPRDGLALRVRLTDAVGNTWGAALERDNDLLHRFPIDTWELHQLYAVMVDVNLNPVIPPGEYYVEVTLQDTLTGVALPTTGADAGAAWSTVGKFIITGG